LYLRGYGTTPERFAGVLDRCSGRPADATIKHRLGGADDLDGAVGPVGRLVLQAS
jgi:hypothetical protein